MIAGMNYVAVSDVFLGNILVDHKPIEVPFRFPGRTNFVGRLRLRQPRAKVPEDIWRYRVACMLADPSDGACVDMHIISVKSIVVGVDSIFVSFQLLLK